jgi:hypothetical protein
MSHVPVCPEEYSHISQGSNTARWLQHGAAHAWAQWPVPSPSASDRHPGGCDGQGQCWAPRPYWPSALLRRTWPWYLRRRVRQPLKTEAVNRLGEACFTKAPHGLVTNVPRGAVPAGAQSVARYVAP